MKRRGFFLNSAAIILLIPLLLLLATYEDVSSQIITAQSERSQIERTYDVVSFLNSEFQKALEISGKRAVVAAVDYVATTGNFINPSYKANKTIADLMLNGSSRSISNYDPGRIMQDQTLRVWFSNLGSLLLKQGYNLSGDISKADITVAPLDAFTLVIKARIPQVTVKDLSGKVVYSGPIPSGGGYIYSTVDLRGLEDPMFSAFTGGRYQRSIKACPMSYPQLGQLPISYANGSGVSSKEYIVGNLRRIPASPSDLGYNETYVWDQNGNYLTNFTIGGVPATTESFIRADGDRGLLVFSGTKTGRAYDLQLFLDCLLDQRYIATESGWSFFERLEGSNGNHNSYVNLAHSIQDEMKYKYGNKYYPIGLVSFMIPHAVYDGKLLNLMKTLGLASTNVSSADYYFLTYYFKRGPKVEGYRVWGISQGGLSTGDLSNVPFFIDLGTAREVLGTIGACDLLYGYRCS
ncbi:hypothetical protein [Thermococcus zilligii]|uniref:hypothetical protein n=1 Tax=Thermococcus zilligii TaxID=54076 RepID=UPI00029A198D|nr:hypothetical protein [Thermococcus zilligii]